MNFSTPPLETTKSMNHKVDAPQKTFFFEREDGTVFGVNEQAAWNIYSGKAQVIGFRNKQPKLVGTSNGMIVNNSLMQAKVIFETEGIEKAQAYLRQAQELEIEEAKKHPEAPRNFDTMDNSGRPVRISDLR